VSLVQLLEGPDLAGLAAFDERVFLLPKGAEIISRQD